MPDGPNTLDSCTDGTSGYFHSDESVDSIRISSVGGGDMQAGQKVDIVAKVWAYNPSTDFVDFYHAIDATNPQWQFIETVKPISSSANTLSTQYTLGSGSLQAVRVVIRFNGEARPCPKGSYDDVDDIVFPVKSSSDTVPKVLSYVSTTKPTPLPTPKPTSISTLKPSRIPTKKPSNFLSFNSPTKPASFLFKEPPKPTPVPTPEPKSGK
jgi:hypothetical protein